MRTTVFIALLFPLSLLSQETKHSKGYFSLALGTYFSNDVGETAVGFHLNGNGAIGQRCFAGLEIGVVIFQDLEGLYVPFLAKFTFLQKQDPKKISPIAVIEPGFGLYNKSQMGGSAEGGINFFGGAGLAFPAKGKGRPFVVVGYSLFGLKTDEVQSNIETFGLKFGFMLR